MDIMEPSPNSGIEQKQLLASSSSPAGANKEDEGEGEWLGSYFFYLSVARLTNLAILSI